MSHQAVSWVLEHSKARGTDRLVLVVLAEAAGAETWKCWPSVRRIAQRAAVSESAVHRALRNLADAGDIIIERQAGGSEKLNRFHRPNLYRVAPGYRVPTATPPSGTGYQERHPPGIGDEPDRVSLVAPKPLREPSKKRDSDPIKPDWGAMRKALGRA